MNYEAKKPPTILLEREAVPLVFDMKEGAYLPAPYGRKKKDDNALVPQVETLPGYTTFRSQECPPARDKDKDVDYKVLVSVVTLLGAMGMGILLIRTLYTFSPFVTMLLVGSGLCYTLYPTRKEGNNAAADPQTPRKIPRMVREEEEVTIFYYKSKKSKSYDS